MMPQKKIGAIVLCSGRGSNFESIAQAAQNGKIPLEILALCSDREQAPVLDRAKRRGIAAYVLNGDRTQRETQLLAYCEKLNPRFLVLAGYMRVLSARVIDAFRSESGYSRITNIHPSLLPAFKGLGGYTQAFNQGAKETGVTVHLVEPELDSGPILAQESFSITDCRSALEVEERGLAIEHRLYPETLAWALTEQFRIEGNRCLRA